MQQRRKYDATQDSSVRSNAAKRRKTRARLVAAAMSLFLEKGYEDVTVGDIATAADLTRRTFFYYFPSKEELVAAWQDDFGTRLAAAVAARPARESLVAVVEEALTSTLSAASAYDITIDRLISRTPALLLRERLKYGELEDSLASALMKRVRGEGGKLRAQLLAVIVVGAVRLARDDRRRSVGFASSAPVTYATSQVFEALWAELRQIGIAGLAAKCNKPPKR